MGTDFVRLFDLGLARRLVKLDRDELERWLDENLGALREKACRRAEQARSLARTGLVEDVEELRARTCEEYASAWERRRDAERAAPPGPLPAELRDDLAERAAVEGEREISLDYWGCLGVGFEATKANGAIESQEILPTRFQEMPDLRAPPGSKRTVRVSAFLLLLPAHLDRMIQSLRDHRGEWAVMTEESLRRLADFRGRCARDRALRVAYFVDV